MKIRALQIGAVALVLAAPASANTLSAYDRVSVAVVDGEEFSSGKNGADEGFLIGSDGQLIVPRLGKIPAAGRQESQLESELSSRLGEYIRVPTVSVRLVTVSPVAVEVSGAIYRPGTVTILPESYTPTAVREVSALRTVFNAVKRAGGIRPDADLAGIELERDGVRQKLALGQDAPVITGDRIIVPSLGNGNYDALNVPSQLAPNEITVYVSGQDLPKGGAINLRPGTPLSGALSAAGGSGDAFLRSGRQVTLIRKGTPDGKREVTSYAIDKVIRGETDPKLLQDDSIAIDAGATANTASFFSLLSPLLTPFLFLFGR